jgi:hypothetical protein
MVIPSFEFCLAGAIGGRPKSSYLSLMLEMASPLLSFAAHS